MNDTISSTSTQATKGGRFGYLIRRMIHLSILVWPVLFYHFSVQASHTLHTNQTTFLLAIMAILVIGESIRVKLGLQILGQRDHEKHKFSSAFWGLFGIALVVLTVPGGITHGAHYAYPIILGTALGDPLLGEMRRFKVPAWLNCAVTYGVLLAIWFFAAHFFAMPLLLTLLAPAVTIAVEWPRQRLIDDNFLMLVAPLLLVWFVR